MRRKCTGHQQTAARAASVATHDIAVACFDFSVDTHAFSQSHTALEWSLAHLLRHALPAASEELIARIKAHDEHVAQQMAAAAWRRRRGRICKALIVGAVTGASLMLAAAWRGAAKERRDAAAKPAACPTAA